MPLPRPSFGSTKVQSSPYRPSLCRSTQLTNRESSRPDVPGLARREQGTNRSAHPILRKPMRVWRSCALACGELCGKGRSRERSTVRPRRRVDEFRGSAAAALWLITLESKAGAEPNERAQVFGGGTLLGTRGAVASARQSNWNVAGPEGPKNFEQNRTDCQHKCVFHGSLL